MWHSDTKDKHTWMEWKYRASDRVKTQYHTHTHTFPSMQLFTTSCDAAILPSSRQASLFYLLVRMKVTTVLCSLNPHLRMFHLPGSCWGSNRTECNCVLGLLVAVLGWFTRDQMARLFRLKTKTKPFVIVVQVLKVLRNIYLVACSFTPLQHAV